MIEVEIPGLAPFRLQHLVLDVNGTIAKDGQLIEGVPQLLSELRSKLVAHLITADTHGSQDVLDQALGLTATRIPLHDQANAKLDYIEHLGAERVVAIGNGANDAAMLAHAALGIVIVGPEGAAVDALLKARVAVSDIKTALELLLHPKRLVATLRI